MRASIYDGGIGARYVVRRDFLAWVKLAGIDLQRFRHHVLTPRRRRRYLELLDELFVEKRV